MYERIEALEYEVSVLHNLVRCYEKILMILFLMIVLCFTISSFQKFISSQSITTKMVRIVDDRGNTVALISSDEKGGFVFVMNSTGKLVSWIAASERGGDISVLNNNGKTAASIWVSPTGNGILSIHNAHGQLIYAVP